MGINSIKSDSLKIEDTKGSSINRCMPTQACVLQSLNILQDEENLSKLNNRVHQVIPSLKSKFGKGIKNFENIEKQINVLLKTPSTLDGLKMEKIFNEILKNFKGLDKKNKLATFLFIFGSVKGLNRPTIMRYLDQVYKNLPRNYKKSIQELEKGKQHFYLEAYSISSVENIFLKTWNFSAEDVNAISMILNSKKLNKIL